MPFQRRYEYKWLFVAQLYFLSTQSDILTNTLQRSSLTGTNIHQGDTHFAREAIYKYRYTFMDSKNVTHSNFDTHIRQKEVSVYFRNINLYLKFILRVSRISQYGFEISI